MVGNMDIVIKQVEFFLENAYKKNPSLDFFYRFTS